MIIVQGLAGLARLLGISKQAVGQYVQAGMPSTQIGLHTYFNSVKVAKWLRAKSPRHAKLAEQLANRVAEIARKCD